MIKSGKEGVKTAIRVYKKRKRDKPRLPPTSSRTRLKPVKHRKKLHASQFIKKREKPTAKSRAQGKKPGVVEHQAEGPAPPPVPSIKKKRRKVALYQPPAGEDDATNKAFAVDSETPKYSSIGEELADSELKDKVSRTVERLEASLAKRKKAPKVDLDELSKKEIEELENEIDKRYETWTEWFQTTNRSDDAAQEYFAELADDIVQISWDLALNPGGSLLMELAKDVMEPNGYGPKAQRDWVERILKDLKNLSDEDDGKN
jgi:hypothetical protein